MLAVTRWKKVGGLEDIEGSLDLRHVDKCTAWITNQVLKNAPTTASMEPRAYSVSSFEHVKL